MRADFAFLGVLTAAAVVGGAVFAQSDAGKPLPTGAPSASADVLVAQVPPSLPQPSSQPQPVPPLPPSSAPRTPTLILSAPSALPAATPAAGGDVLITAPTIAPFSGLVPGPAINEMQLKNAEQLRNLSNLEKQVQESLDAYAKSDNAQVRETMKLQIVKQLEQQFELRQKLREEELQALESKLNKLRAQVTRRREKKFEIIQHRVDQLLRDADGLGWGGDSEQANSAPSVGFNFLEQVFHHPEFSLRVTEPAHSADAMATEFGR